MRIKVDKEITPGTIIGIILFVLFIIWFVVMSTQNPSNSKSMRELRRNEGKHYTEMEFEEFGACDRLIGGTVQEYGDDLGYYCYQTTNTDGKVVWKVGKVEK